MSARDLKQKSVSELKALQGELRRELFNLRMQQYTNQLDKPHRIRETRRQIARVETVLRQAESA